MSTVLKTTFQFKRGTAKKWQKLNLVLASGEPGFETDTGKVKIGTGVTPWNNLNYITETSVITAPTKTEFPQIGAVNCIYKATEEQILYQWDIEKQIYEPLTNGIIDLNDYAKKDDIPKNYLIGGEQTQISTESGGKNIYTFTKSDGTTDELNVLNGLSAYAIAVQNGYTGTETEWLNSLQGESGVYYGSEEPTGNKPDLWINENGQPTELIEGKSAYQVAVDNGYHGTEEEWLATLIGPMGPIPQIGENGNWFVNDIDSGYSSVGTRIAKFLGNFNGTGEGQIGDEVFIIPTDASFPLVDREALRVNDLLLDNRNELGQIIRIEENTLDQVFTVKILLKLKGDSYILTAADKNEIVQGVLSGLGYGDEVSY